MELQGFKSFPDKTVLSFSRPITAIVGPNGSGKSNLSDAIRWVLGEQSAKSLRGGRMEDVIFSGAQARKRQGFAQVTLTLEECQDLLPDGGEEAAVTRRYYRSGESEYYINGKAVRLRDVNELFMDTGLGQEGYALIGQGKIDEILSAKSTQRREIFEEAAGISHCRHQKEETQRKLERTEENLLRIGDKLEELELQRGPLQAQAEKARQYLALKEELRTLEISLWMEQLDHQRALGETFAADHAAAQQELAACTQEADRLYAKGEDLLLRLRDQTARGEALAVQLRENETQRQEVRQRRALLTDRIRANAAGAQRTQGDLAQHQSRRQDLEAELARQETHLAQLEDQQAQLQQRLGQAQGALAALQAQAKDRTAAWQAEVRQAQQDLDACRRREQQAEETWRTLRLEADTLHQRVKLLGEMASHYEGYVKGVKTAMTAVRQGELRGVLGPVGELFQVDRRYTVALETALGAAMQNLLVEDEEAGKAVLRLVKQRQGGRVTCLPLTALRPASLREEGIEREPGYLAVAADLVRCRDEVRPAAAALLGRTVVVDNLDHGVRLAKSRRYRFPVVTLDGEILRPGGSMTGGSVDRKGGILSRGAEEAALGKQLTAAQQAADRAQTQLEAARAAVQQATQSLETRQRTGPMTSEELSAAQRRQEEALYTLREELAAVQGTGGIDFDAVARILLATLSLYLLSTLCSFVQSWLMTGMVQRLCYKLREDINLKIDRMPFGYFERNSTGDTLSRITNDVDTMGQTLAQSVVQLVTGITTVAGVLVMMLLISPLMTLVALLIIPVSLALVMLIVKRSQKYFFAQQEVLGEVNGIIEESFAGQGIIKAFNAEQRTLDSFADANRRLYEAGWKSQFAGGLMKPVMDFVGNLGYVAVALMGGWLAVQGAITVGDIQAFIQYVKNFTQPLSQMSQVGAQLQQMAASAERVFEFLSEDEEADELAEGQPPVNLGELRGAVSFEEVSFGYAPGSEVIRGFSARVEPGQTVALVGPTGAGKTTMVKLLMRFYDVSSGCIRVDGRDLRTIARPQAREMFGMVLQDTWLFGGTIRENIRYGRLDATDEEVEEAARAGCADHFIRTLPGGYDYVINEDSSNVSQGQRQLLTIARAILANRPMLILDEATSSVDTRTEERIQEAMDRLMEGRTSFVIAHRLSTIRNADLILVMRDGDVAEQGTHEELLAKGGFYAELYNSQFEGCE